MACLSGMNSTPWPNRGPDVLLDALEALGEHREALVLVGAQAIYLRVGEADLAVASYTTDGDLAIDPRILVEVPPLEQKLSEAGFKRNGRNPGRCPGRKVGECPCTLLPGWMARKLPFRPPLTFHPAARHPVPRKSA